MFSGSVDRGSWSDLDSEFQGLRFSDNEMENLLFARGHLLEDFDCDPWITSRVAFAELM